MIKYPVSFSYLGISDRIVRDAAAPSCSRESGLTRRPPEAENSDGLTFSVSGKTRDNLRVLGAPSARRDDDAGTRTRTCSAARATALAH